MFFQTITIKIDNIGFYDICIGTTPDKLVPIHYSSLIDDDDEISITLEYHHTIETKLYLELICKPCFEFHNNEYNNKDVLNNILNNIVKKNYILTFSNQIYHNNIYIEIEKHGHNLPKNEIKMDYHFIAKIQNEESKTTK